MMSWGLIPVTVQRSRSPVWTVSRMTMTRSWTAPCMRIGSSASFVLPEFRPASIGTAAWLSGIPHTVRMSERVMALYFDRSSSCAVAVVRL